VTVACPRCASRLWTVTIDGDWTCLLCGQVVLAPAPLAREIAQARALPPERRKPGPKGPRVYRTHRALGIWSKTDECCRRCQSAARPFKAKGLCTRCYQAWRFETVYKKREVGA
jgi:hypothetical protein